MGVIFDYFAADSDEQATAVIDMEQGPATPGSGVTTIETGGVDPAVQLATLEELLTGTPYDEIADRPRHAECLAARNDHHRLVLALSDELTTALAEATQTRLAEVATPWSETDEFFGAAAPEDLIGFLTAIAGLAREAQAKGQQLYCWVCV